MASGGEAFDTIVDGGGLANFHGTTVIGGTISGGGTLALLDNAAAGGTFTFAGGGILQVEVPQPFPALNILSAAVVDGFGANDTIAVTAVPLDPGPVGVALMSGNVLQLAANGFLFDLYLDPTQNFNGKAFALTSDGSGDYFISLSQTIISTGTAFISAGLVVSAGGLADPTTILGDGFGDHQCRWQRPWCAPVRTSTAMPVEPRSSPVRR